LEVYFNETIGVINGEFAQALPVITPTPPPGSWQCVITHLKYVLQAGVHWQKSTEFPFCLHFSFCLVFIGAYFVDNIEISNPSAVVDSSKWR
jgi:hypothetical protein